MAIRHFSYSEREKLMEALELIESVRTDDQFLAASLLAAERALDEALTTDEVED